MLSIRSVVWGVRDVARGMAFWTAVLDDVVKKYPDETWAILVPRQGAGVQLALSLTTSEKPKRHHLDLYADDQVAEVERLLALGATRVE